MSNKNKKLLILCIVSLFVVYCPLTFVVYLRHKLFQSNPSIEYIWVNDVQCVIKDDYYGTIPIRHYRKIAVCPGDKK